MVSVTTKPCADVVMLNVVILRVEVPSIEFNIWMS
jgi:hypothetical protein